MQTADFNVDSFQQSNQREADKHLLVKFYLAPKKDNARSIEEGRPIFKDVDFVDIRVPGNRDNVIIRPASRDDINRFPDHYKAYQDRLEVPEEGTPLSEWSGMSRSMAEELSFAHVKTVEQLANMADSQVGKFMGLYSIKDRAKAWLEQAASQKPFMELKALCAKQSEEIAKLNEIVGDLVATQDEDETKPKKRKKRRTKQEIAEDKILSLE